MQAIHKEKEVKIIGKQIIHMIVYGSNKFISKFDAKKKKKIKFVSWTYSLVICFFILLSLISLILPIETLQKRAIVVAYIEFIVLVLLCIDYLLRWYTFDIETNKHKKWIYLFFPFRPMSIMLLLGIIPSFYAIDILPIDTSDTIWSILRVMKLLRIMRIILVLSLVPSLNIFSRIIKKNRGWLIIVFFLVVLIILLFAMGIYLSESEYYLKYHKRSDHPILNYWQAIYYCTIAITTIGFGDYIVLSNLAKTLTIALGFLGIIILTFPSGILAGCFIAELKEMEKHGRKQQK